MVWSDCQNIQTSVDKTGGQAISHYIDSIYTYLYCEFRKLISIFTAEGFKVFSLR